MSDMAGPRRRLSWLAGGRARSPSPSLALAAPTPSAPFWGRYRPTSAPRGSVSLVFCWPGFFISAWRPERSARRLVARPLAVFGMIVMGAGLAAAGVARSLTEVYVAYGLGVGIGVGCAYVPALGAVQRWFVRRRGLASGLAVSGIGVGTLVMPPLASCLIAAFGWRETYLILGGIAVVIGGGLAMLIENDPGRRGLAPDGDLLRRRSRPRRPEAPARGGQVAPLHRLYVACLIGCSAVRAVRAPRAVRVGSRPGASSAVLLLGIIGVGSIAGRFARRDRRPNGARRRCWRCSRAWR